MCAYLESHAELEAQFKTFGKPKVEEAVRAAYVSVLSRAFNVAKNEEGDTRLALIPVIDLLQHSSAPSVQYSFEEEGQDGKFLVARALGDHPKGRELSITYGAHPDFVFAVHYGFVPPLKQQRASCYTVLRLMDAMDAVGVSAGALAALAAQDAADRNGVDALEEWTVDSIRAEPSRALGTLFDTSGASAQIPLRFGVSSENLDALTGVLATDRAIGDEANAPESELHSLLAASRLCALRDDGSGNSDEIQTAAAMCDILLSGSIDALNDVEAALLVATAAQLQLASLRRAEDRAEELAARASVIGAAEASDGAMAPNAECITMAKALRDSERIVLDRLCSGGDAGRLFGISNWAALYADAKSHCFGERRASRTSSRTISRWDVAWDPRSY